MFAFYKLKYSSKNEAISHELVFTYSLLKAISFSVQRSPCGLIEDSFLGLKVDDLEVKKKYEYCFLLIHSWMSLRLCSFSTLLPPPPQCFVIQWKSYAVELFHTSMAWMLAAGKKNKQKQIWCCCYQSLSSKSQSGICQNIRHQGHNSSFLWRCSFLSFYWVHVNWMSSNVVLGHATPSIGFVHFLPYLFSSIPMKKTD